MADTGMILAFIGVVAVTVYQAGGAELKNFFNTFNKVQEQAVQKALEEANKT